MSKQCSAKNRNGKRCGAWALRGAPQCALHSDPKRPAEMGSKHGRILRFPSSLDALELPHRPLETVGQGRELLEETINRVRQGPFHLRAANTIGFLASILLKAREQERIENELNALSSLPRRKVEGEVLEHELMRMVVELDPDKRPKAKLEAIIAAYVVNGTLENKGTRRVAPAETRESGGNYTALFARLKRGDGVQREHVPPRPLFPDVDPAPLFPNVSPSTVPMDPPLPAPSESIDD